jgi:hypothetical protein
MTYSEQLTHSDGTKRLQSILNPMRRFMALLLLIALPIQFGLADYAHAIEYGRGDTEHDSAQHFHGPFDHSHDVNSHDGGSSGHADCGTCHCLHSIALVSPSVRSMRRCDAESFALSRASARPAQTNGARPERPKWIALV